MQESPGTDFTLPADLVLIAMGFVHVVHAGLVEELGLKLDGRGNVVVNRWMTSVPGVFAAGDTVKGASLVVHAINHGRLGRRRGRLVARVTPSPSGRRAGDEGRFPTGRWPMAQRPGDEGKLYLSKSLPLIEHELVPLFRELLFIPAVNVLMTAKAALLSRRASTSLANFAGCLFNRPTRVHASA